MSIFENIEVLARAFPARGMALDPTIVSMTAWVRTDDGMRRGTVVAARDDAFERGWSWPRHVFRYAVQVDDGGPLLPWVDAREIWLVVTHDGSVAPP